MNSVGKAEMCNLYCELSPKFGKSLPKTLLRHNEDGICNAICRALDGTYVAASITAIVVVDMLELCNEDPFLANEVVSNPERSLMWVKSQFLVVIGAILRDAGIRIACTTDLALLANLHFEIKNMYPGMTRSLKSFYESINEKVFFTSESDAVRVPGSGSLLFFEASVELVRKVCFSWTRVYRCDNPLCKNNNYIVEKEALDLRGSDGDAYFAASGLRDCPKTSNGPDTKRYVTESKRTYFNVEHTTRNVSVLAYDPEMKCTNCQLALREKQCHHESAFRYEYRLHESMLNIHGYSYFPLATDKCVVVGHIVRNNTLRPELCILGSFSPSGPNALEIRQERDTMSALRSLSQKTHSSFVSNDESHRVLLIVLSIFATREARIIIYTNEVDYVKHYSHTYFTTFGIDVEIRFDLSNIDAHPNALFLRPVDEVDFPKNIHADFVFMVKIDNADIDYEYDREEACGRIVLCGSEMKPDVLPHIQKSFINLRAFFRETINPPKLLSYVHSLSSSLSYLTQKDISQKDVCMIEHTFKNVIVSDTEACEPMRRHKRICIKKDFPPSARDVRSRQ